MSQELEKLETLFQEAVALKTEAERADYLNAACPDPAARREVETLIACHQNPDRVFAKDTIRVAFTESRNFDRDTPYIGKTLDEKYRLDRLLGQGGMGAVYLSTHLGTGRSVAVKLITPQFMRNPQFVERFKREARAAGRLRHPNIVDVTDFGVAKVENEDLAYLVMEYLDGCTLGEVLADESRLPLHWVVNILEQVCSAVHEAHRRGIIHRDLKPANIWLEPNPLGGYRVKVLDFGIAKLAETEEHKILTHQATIEGQETPPSAPGAELTQVGAIMGTPWYMSPEQCRAEGLDARSDVYSLGVIAYQMLAGTTPFTGDPIQVLRAQEFFPPKPLRVHNRKVPEAVSRVIMSALEKSPSARPQSALALAQVLRANAEGLGDLYRRAFALYSEYFPKVITLSLLAHVPVIAVILMMVGVSLAQPSLSKEWRVALELLVGLLKMGASFLTASVIGGVIAIIITHLAVTPMKPVSLRASFEILRGRWRPFLQTGLIASVRVVLGLVLFVVPGLVLMVRYALWAPVVLLEGVEWKAALGRSRILGQRSRRTIVAAVLFQAMIPALVQWVITSLVGLGTAEKNSVQHHVIKELVGLSSIFVLPLVSMMLALVYLKLRKLAGEEMTQVMERIEKAGTREKWEQRTQARIDSKNSELNVRSGLEMSPDLMVKNKIDQHDMKKQHKIWYTLGIVAAVALITIAIWQLGRNSKSGKETPASRVSSAQSESVTQEAQKVKLEAQWGLQIESLLSGDRAGFEKLLSAATQTQSQKVDLAFGLVSKILRALKITQPDLRIEDVSFNKELTQATVKTAHRDAKAPGGWKPFPDAETWILEDGQWLRQF